MKLPMLLLHSAMSTATYLGKKRCQMSYFRVMLIPRFSIGVHRGAETSMDISADLIELARTPVIVVSSGCKSFLDIPRTLEVLETQGVTVATFADGREGAVDFPAFWTRESGISSPLTVRNEAEAAAMICE